MKSLQQESKFYVSVKSHDRVAKDHLGKISNIQMIDVHLPTTDGRHIVMSRYTQPEKDVSLLLAQLGLTLPEQPPPKVYASGQVGSAFNAIRHFNNKKFYRSSIKTSGLLYKNPQKKIYVEVRRVFEFLTSTGVKYEIDVQSIESERVIELIKERENMPS
ncbi:MAG: hypothetical protein DPW20_07620 [Candidatus Brocadia sp.]|nr:hypothetical protein [Candidatus Brocadia sp.]